MYGFFYENDLQVNVNVCWEKKFKFLNSVENLYVVNQNNLFFYFEFFNI